MPRYFRRTLELPGIDRAPQPVSRLLPALILFAAIAPAQQLPGTAPLTGNEDLSVKMMDGAHRFVERKIAASVEARQRHWKRDFSSPAAYEASIQPNRARFLQKIGVVDARLPVTMERFGDEN